MLSVVMPFWERQEALERSLALMTKHYANVMMEVIIVDDGSPMPCILRERIYPWPVRIIRLEYKREARNPCVPINIGVQAAHGDVILLTNPEILHNKPVIGAMLEELQQLGPKGYVLAAAWCPEQRTWHCHSTISGDRPDLDLKLPRDSGFHFCAMFSRMLWVEAGGFDPDYRDGQAFEDADWVQRVARAGGIFKIRDDLVVEHIKEGAQTIWPAGGHERNWWIYRQKWPGPKLNVVCVKYGDSYGPQYVNRLYAMVARNLRGGTPGTFHCFTDDATDIRPEVQCHPLPGDAEHMGWWWKLCLFRPGLFTPGDRIVYLDLDTVLVGQIDDLCGLDCGFAILRDFYRPEGLGSGVMAWEAGNWTTEIYEQWEAQCFPEPEGGDQAWIEECLTQRPIGGVVSLLQDELPGQVCSYKLDCNPLPPKTASIVCFHGHPRPHEVDRSWVVDTWSETEVAGVVLEQALNTAREVIAQNKQRSLGRGTRLKSKPAHTQELVLVGGGPSAEKVMPLIKKFARDGMCVWGVNGSSRWLAVRHDIWTDATVIIDARPDNLGFIDQYNTTYYLADHCDISLYDMAQKMGSSVVRVDTDQMGNCGTTSGTYACHIAYVEGFRVLHLFGFDSSYEGDEHHAYPQQLNDKDKRLKVELEDGTVYYAAPWMFQQAQDFMSMVPALLEAGCQVCVYGEGLIPAIARRMQPEIPPA